MAHMEPVSRAHGWLGIVLSGTPRAILASPYMDNSLLVELLKHCPAGPLKQPRELDLADISL